MEMPDRHYLFQLIAILGLFTAGSSCSEKPPPWEEASTDSGGEDSSDEEEPTDTEEGVPPIPEGEELAFTEDPTFEGNDNPAVPQVGILTLETNYPARVDIEVSGGGETWILEREGDPRLEEPILGLKPDTRYSISVSARAGDQEITHDSLEWTSPPLPAGFPPIDVPVCDPDELEPGMSMFNVWNGIGGSSKPLIIVDHEGIVRWYYDGDPVYDDHRRLPNGNFLFSPDECVIEEVDMQGDLVRSWHAATSPTTCDVPEDAVPVAVDSFHHELSMLPNGDLLVLSSEVREIEDFPTSEDDPDAPRETAPAVGAIILEFTPEGEILKYIPLMDILDPTRIGRDSLSSSWSLIFRYREDGQVPRDWDHANALVYEKASDAYYVSVRHQDAIIKVNRADESLEWILGTPSNWESPWDDRLLTPVGDLAWPYHQHAVELTLKGIGMYDNGNHRASAYETPNDSYSRAVLFSVDEEEMTVEQIWSFGESSGSDAFYSSAMGDADWQPTEGNVLICKGLLRGENGSYSQIVEVSEEGEILFELTVQEADGSSNYAMHRARRIPDIRR